MSLAVKLTVFICPRNSCSHVTEVWGPQVLWKSRWTLALIWEEQPVSRFGNFFLWQKNRLDCWIRVSASSRFGLGVVAMVKVPDILVHQIDTLPTKLRLKNAIKYSFLSDSLPTDFYWDIILQPPLLSYLLPNEFCCSSYVNDPFLLHRSISIINDQLSWKLCRLLTTESLKTRDQ